MKIIIRPHLTHRVSTCVLTVRTFNFTPKVLAGETGSTWARKEGSRVADSWTHREHASEEMWARREECNRLLALKERLKVRSDRMDEIERHFADAIRDAPGKEKSRLKECGRSIGKMREAQKELENHVDGILDDIIEEGEADPLMPP